MIKMGKKAQEEMVGFALIVIIVSVILLIFLSFYLRSSNEVKIQSYEADGFVQAILQYTSDCEKGGELLSVQDLVLEDESCSDERTTKEVLNETLTEICENSWDVGEDTPIKGYEMKINSEEENIFMLNKGNITQNYRSGFQDFSRRGKDYRIDFIAYY